MRLSSSSSGTSPAAMRSASPSAMAVLPTPGSPMSTGLFLLRRDKIWMTRCISVSRPITGSSLPLRAASVRSRVYSASVLFFLSASRLGAEVPPAAARGISLSFFSTALYILLGSTPTVRRIRRPMLPPSRSRPISRWAVPMVLLPMRDASDTASSTTLLARGVSPWLGAAPETPLPTLRCSTEQTISSVTPNSLSTRWAVPSSSRIRPSSRCSEPT